MSTSESSSGANIQSSGENNQVDQDPKDGLYPKDFVEKLKKEKANARSEAENLKKLLQEKESADLEKAGKLNELVQLERQRASELEGKNKDLSSMIIQKAVINAVRSQAESLGAQYMDVIERMVDHSLIDVNPETLDVDINSIKNQIMGIKSKMPLLFKTGAPKTNDLVPNNNNVNSSLKSLNDLSVTELKDLLRKQI